MFSSLEYLHDLAGQIFLIMKKANVILESQGFTEGLIYLTDLINCEPDIPDVYFMRSEVYQSTANRLVNDPTPPPLLKSLILQEFERLPKTPEYEERPTQTETESLIQKARLLSLHDLSTILELQPGDDKVLFDKITLLKKLQRGEEGNQHIDAWKKALATTNTIKASYHEDLQIFLAHYFDKQLAIDPNQILTKEMHDFLKLNRDPAKSIITPLSSKHVSLGIKSLGTNKKLALYHFETAMHYFRLDFIATTFYAHLCAELDPSDVHRSLAILTEVIEQFNYPPAYFFRGSIYHNLGYETDARADIIQFVKLGTPEHFLQFQHQKNIIIFYAQNLPVFTDQNQTKMADREAFTKAKQLLTEKKWKPLAKLIKQLTTSHPFDSSLLLLQQFAFSKQNNFQEAMRALSTACFLSRKTSPEKEDYFARSILYLDIGLPLLSFMNFRFSLSIRPQAEQDTFIKAYLSAIRKNLAFLLDRSQQNYRQILQLVDVALFFDKDPYLLKIKGSCHQRLLEFGDMLESFQESLALKDTPETRELVVQALDTIKMRALSQSVESPMKLIDAPAVEQPKPITTIAQAAEPSPAQIEKQNAPTNLFKNHPPRKKRENITPIKLAEIEPDTIDDEKAYAALLMEEKNAKEQALQAKQQRAKEKKLREKEKRLEKRQAANKSLQVPTEDTTQSPSQSIAEIEPLLPTSVKNQDDGTVIISLLPIEKEIFASTIDFIAARPELKGKHIRLSGGSTADRIRQTINEEQFCKIDSDIDFITDIPCPYLCELFPTGSFSHHLDGYFSFFKEDGNKKIKIDIFHLPDLKPFTILQHKDFFPFIVDEHGKVTDLTAWGIASLKANKLKPVQIVSEMFSDPIVILRTLYQSTKRNLYLSKNIIQQIKKDMHRLSDESLVSTERVNIWITNTLSQHMALENYKKLIDFGILQVLFPSHIREFINNNAWLIVQMNETAKFKHPVLQRIYSSFVISITMQNIAEDIAIGLQTHFSRENIYAKARQVISESRFFTSAFNNLPLEKFLEPAIKRWLQFYKPEITLSEQATLSQQVRFFLLSPQEQQTPVNPLRPLDDLSYATLPSPSRP